MPLLWAHQLATAGVHRLHVLRLDVALCRDYSEHSFLCQGIPIYVQQNGHLYLVKAEGVYIGLTTCPILPSIYIIEVQYTMATTTHSASCNMHGHYHADKYNSVHQCVLLSV